MGIQSTNAQREIYFLHGSGGTEISWNHYDTRYAPRTGVENTRRFSYTTNQGFEMAATTAREMIDGDIIGVSPTPNQNIGWGHSMGGLTLHQLELGGNASDIGGFITSGTSINGAKMANSFASGAVSNYLLEGCEEVLAGPISAIEDFMPDFTFAFMTDVGLLTSDNLCGTGLLGLLDASGGPFTGAQTIEDLSENSSALQAINNNLTNKPIITLFGSEQSPVHWRWFNDVIPGNQPSLTPFEQSTPETVLDIMTAVQDVEETAAVLFHALYVASTSIPLAWLSGVPGNASNAKHQFSQGANWLAASEAGWNDLIGANDSFTTVTYTGSELNADCAALIATSGWGAYYQLSTQEQLDCWGTVVTTTTIPVGGISDGIVHHLAAKIPGVCALEILEANHQELVNHPNATVQYDEIMNETCNCPFSIQQWFATE